MFGYQKPTLDRSFSVMAGIILLGGLGLWLAGNLYLPLLNGLTVQYIEMGQAIYLLTMMFYSGYIAYTFQQQPAIAKFWLWTVLWWLLLFERSISWGRDFWPDVPKIYYRLLSIVFIALPLITLCLPTIRQEIARRWRYEAIPIWYIIFMCLFFLLADAAEHHRFGYSLLVWDSYKQDLIEELLEIPCLLAIGAMSVYLQNRDRKHYLLTAHVVKAP